MRSARPPDSRLAQGGDKTGTGRRRGGHGAGRQHRQRKPERKSAPLPVHAKMSIGCHRHANRNIGPGGQPGSAGIELHIAWLNRKLGKEMT